MRLRFGLPVLLALTPALYAQTTRTVPAQYSTIAAAVAASAPGDKVVVSTGTYHEHISITSAITLESDPSIQSVVTLNGDGLGPAITITGAAANGAGVFNLYVTNAGKPQTSGGPSGAIYINGASPIVQGNQITANYCAGIQSVNANPLIAANLISGTLSSGCPAAEGLGSAIVLNGSASDKTIAAARIYLNNITGNTASVGYSADTGGGGGINITNVGAVVIDHNTITGNVSTGYGGAFYLATSTSLYFLNNLVYGNKGVSGGLDLVFGTTSYSYIANNTIAGNTATAANAGSDVYVGGNLAQADFINNIVVGYSSSVAAINCGTSTGATPLVVDHNDLFNAAGGTVYPSSCSAFAESFSNKSVDPKFVNGASALVTAGSLTADLHLQSSSPLIDAGNNSVYETLYTVLGGKAPFDMDGNDRFVGISNSYPVVDMGAYELQGGVNTSSNYLADVELIPASYTPTIGQPLKLNANVFFCNQSLTPTGVVTFLMDNAVIGSGTLSSASASFTLASFPTGTHFFSANYQAPNGAAAMSVPLYLTGIAATQTATQTILTAATLTPTLSQPDLLTATVSALTGTATPTGTVYFSDGAVTLGSAAVNASGIATYNATFTTPGVHSLTAAFVATANFAGSTGSLTVTAIGLASQSVLSVAPSPVISNGTTTLTVKVGPAGGTSAVVPTGTVTFLEDTITVGAAPLAAGTALLSIGQLTSGLHTFTCTYPGDTVYGPSSCGAVVVNVVTSTASTLTSSLNPSGFGQLVIFSDIVQPDAKANGGIVTGTVSFYDGSTLLGTVVPGQVGCVNCSTGTVAATFSISTLSIGSHPISAVYTPTGNFQASTATLTQVVQPVAAVKMTLGSSLNPSYATQPVTFTANLSSVDPTNGVPTGTVTFYDGATPLSGQPLVNGVATFTTTKLSIGQHNINAVYMPTVAYGQASAALTQTVNFIADGALLTISPTNPTAGTPIVATATVSSGISGITGTPTGFVSFYLDTTTLVGTVALVNASASVNIPALASGPHSISCSYAGDTEFAHVDCNDILLNVTAATTTMSLTSSANPTYALTPVTFNSTLTITGTTTFVPRGISFLLDGAQLGSGQVNPNGVAATTQSLNAGTHNVAAVWQGDSSYTAATARLTETVLANTTSTTLLVSPNPASLGQSVTLAVSVLDTTGARSPNGTITITDTNGTVVASGSTNASSSASKLANVVYTTSSLAVGTHNLTATYTPADGNFLASSSSAVSLTVVLSGITLASDPQAISIQTQHHNAVTLTVGSVGGYGGNVQLACATPLPPVLSCEFAHAYLAVGSNGTAGTALTLETDAIPNFESIAPLDFRSGRGRWLGLLGLSTLAWLAVAGRKRRRLRVLAMLLLAFTAATALSGCGNKWPDHTPPGTYTVTINAVGSIGTSPQAPQASTNITLTVTP